VHTAAAHIIHANGKMGAFAESPLIKIGLPSESQYEADVSVAWGHINHFDIDSEESIFAYRECMSMVCPIAANNSQWERFMYLSNLPQLWSHTGMQLQKQSAVYAVMPAASSEGNKMCRFSHSVLQTSRGGLTCSLHRNHSADSNKQCSCNKLLKRSIADQSSEGFVAYGGNSQKPIRNAADLEELMTGPKAERSTIVSWLPRPLALQSPFVNGR
jgi:hypothetical protein